MKALVKNAADEEQVSTAGLKERFGRDRKLDDWKAVLSTVQGRRVVWDLLQFCGISKSSMASTPEQTFFLEGQRNIGLKVQADVMDASPESYLLMMKESKGDRDV